MPWRTATTVPAPHRDACLGRDRTPLCGTSRLQCRSDCYGTLKGRSEREIMLATAELLRRHQNHSTGFHVTARRLDEFLQSIEAQENLLTQRLRDG